MTKTITLSGERGRGKVAVVDDDDYEKLSGYRWHLQSQGYAARGVAKPDGHGELVLMHRVITGAGPGEKVDHRDRDRLNNTRGNLRLATHAQNLHNTGPYSHRDGRPTASRYKGVWFNKRTQRWMAEMRFEGRKLSLGGHPDEQSAAEAYDRAARELHGEFACLNFPDRTEKSSGKQPSLEVGV